MDICTLASITVMTTQACFTPPICHLGEGPRLLCIEYGAQACPQPERQYECKRPDGTTYLLPQSKAE